MTNISRPPQESVIQFTRRMRNEFLTEPPARWKMQPTPENPTVYGVLMEWLEDEAAMTVVAFCEGSASVYSDTGQAMIGGHTDEVVSREARALVRAAGEFHDQAVPVSTFPFPEGARLQFYLLTFQGVRVLHGSFEPESRGEGQYERMSRHGFAVLMRYLTMDEPHPDHGDGSGYQKEWNGPEGYLNCLLTAMSRGIGRSCVIRAGAPVPDLVALASENDRLRAWLAAQEFPYDAMEGKDVVRAIRKYAHMRPGLPILTRHGEIRAVHVTEDDTLVARVYDVEIAPFDRSAKVHMASTYDQRVRAFQRQTDAEHASAT